MALSLCICDFLSKDLPVLYGVDFKLFRMAKVLEHLTIFVRYCNTHGYIPPERSCVSRALSPPHRLRVCRHPPFISDICQ